MPRSAILQHCIERFQTESSSVSHCADKLRALGYRICTFEDLQKSNERQVRHPLDLKERTLKQILDEIVIENPGYRWLVEDELINIYPVQSALNSPTPALNIKSKGVWRILIEDLEIENKGISLFVELTDGDGQLIDLALNAGSLRDALNGIVRQLGQAVWHISGNPGAYFLTISDIPDAE